MNIFRHSFFPAAAFGGMGCIEKVRRFVIKFEIRVTISLKPHLTKIMYSRGCSNKVSRPGLKKFRIDAIYIPPLQ